MRVCVHMWGSSYFLNLYHIYLSNIIHKIIYRINVIKIYISKKEGKAWKCETLNTIYVNFVLSIVALIIHRPHGGVCVSAFCHLTSWQQGGALKKKCMQKCWECSHEKLYKQLLGVFPWKLVGSANTIHPWFNVRGFFLLGSAAGTAALKDMRCKFDVSLYQSWTFEVSVYIKLTLTLNLHIKSVSLQCTSNLHVNSVSLV